MCTFIMKERGDTVLVLRGVGCCMRVETIEEFVPEISAANGWRETFVETTFPGRRLVDVEINDAASSALKREKPFAELNYRGRTVHFRDRARLAVTIDYVESTLRDARSFLGDQVFLENLPAPLLKRTARATVAKKLRKLASL